MPSVIIPAHNEGRVIGRLLSQLSDGFEPGDLDVTVVSNGSIDDTAEIARMYPGVRVLELAQGSKHLALEAGDRVARGFPRLYVDADVEIDAPSVRALVAALSVGGIQAAAPERRLALDESSWAVRAHYRIWQQLPVVQNGLFGRGVIGVSEHGYSRIADRPHVLGDDLYLHTRFEPSQRRIVTSAHSVVHCPRTVRDLLRRRTRGALGNTELGTWSGGATSTTSSTAREIVRIARRPSQWPSVAVFITITSVGRVQGRRMRRAGSASWLRDDSSRR